MVNETEGKRFCQINKSEKFNDMAEDDINGLADV
ncbi:Uncharacterised protein [Salmonella enterica subsp. salamae]|nr:Uncharacterised protein [Salmonella enterica subsp. salamae]